MTLTCCCQHSPSCPYDGDRFGTSLLAYQEWRICISIYISRDTSSTCMQCTSLHRYALCPAQAVHVDTYMYAGGGHVTTPEFASCHSRLLLKNGLKANVRAIVEMAPGQLQQVLLRALGTAEGTRRGTVSASSFKSARVQLAMTL